MLYIGTTSSEGTTAYVDIHAAERGPEGIRFSGTIGDGQYEGEVLVEIGRANEVTFAGAWLGDRGFPEFIARFGREQLVRDLLESLGRTMLFGLRRDPAHTGSGRHGAGRVAESAPLWEGVV